MKQKTKARTELNLKKIFDQRIGAASTVKKTYTCFQRITGKPDSFNPAR